MKFKVVLYFKAYFLLLISLTCLGCKKRFNCSPSNDLKLGNIDYSTEFKEWESEIYNESLKFSTPDGFQILKKNDNSKFPLRLKEYLVCESIDIKSYKAYAYYEYKNHSSLYSNDSMTMLISVEPYINKENGVITESIFLSFNKSSYGIKGQVPITNVNSIRPTEPHGRLFKYHEDLEIGGRKFYKIWALEKGGSAIYYSKSKGIVALQMGIEFYFREK